MANVVFGATGECYTTDEDLQRIGGVTFTVWDALTGGTRILDLVQSGVATQTVVSSTDPLSLGRIQFEASDQYRYLYIELVPAPGQPTPPRWAVESLALTDAPVASVAGKTGTVVLTADDISGLATVAKTGSAADLTGLATVAKSGKAIDLVGLATVAKSGKADDLTGTLPRASVPDLTDAYATNTALTAVDNDLQGFKEEVPSNEDLLFVWYAGGSYGELSSGDFVIMAAPRDMQINGVSMVWDDSSGWPGITANDTNYVKFTITKKTAAGDVYMAWRTTQITGQDANGSIVNEQDWNFDGAVWQDRTINKGEILKIQISRGGTNPPGDISMEWSVAFRYQRKAAV